MASEIKVDTISEKTSAGGVTIDGLLIKDGGISGDVSLIGTTPTLPSVTQEQKMPHLSLTATHRIITLPSMIQQTIY